MPLVRIATYVMLLLVAESSRADTHYVMQVGANHGLIAGGVGGNYSMLNWATTFGITPSVVDSAAISQVNGKLNVLISDHSAYRLLTGGSAFLNQSGKTFFSLPEKYPDGDYYRPNAYHFAWQVTIEVGGDLFVEASILDYFLEVLVNNPRGSISNGEVVSLGLGAFF